MANLQQVGIELQVKGEAEARRALDNLSKSSKRVTNSIGSVANSVQGAEREFLKLVKLNERNMLSDKALASAKNQLAKRIAVLNGEIDKNGTIYKKNAANALEASKAAMQKAEADKRVAQATREAAQQARAAEKARKEQEAADRRAAQAAEQLARAQKNLEGSVLKQARAVDQAVRRMDELKRLQQSGAAGSRDMAKAEIEVARALARTNGYLKSNGDLNTQKALAELRAAQATRKAAKENEKAARETEALARETEQLAAAYNPVMAAARVYEQRVEQLNRAKKLGVLTEDQMQAELAQSAAAYNEVGQDAAKARNFINNFGGANHIASRQTNAYGMAMQQAGYQVGDFIVQVQSGTNAFVAFGQQATQLVGILPMMAGQFGLNVNRLIGISAALGIVIPLVTALGAGLMRANVEADAIYEKFGFLEGSVRGLGSAFGSAGGVIVNIVMTIVENLDVFVSILGVGAVAATVKFIAATSAMSTVMTSLGLIFTTTGGAALVATSATTALTAAMSRLMVVISAHPIIAAMTAALAVAVAVLYRARDASDGFRSNVEGLSDALKELRDNAKEAGIEAARIELGADTDAQAIAMQRILELNEQIVTQQERIAESSGHTKRNRERVLATLIEERQEIERLLELDRQRVQEMESAAAKSSLDSIISSYDEQYALQLKIADAEEKLNEAVRLELITRERMAEIMDEYKASLDDGKDATEETNQALQRQVTHQMQIATIQKDVNAGVQEILNARDAELQKQQDRIRLAQTELEFGRNSKEFRQAQLEIDERIFRELLAQNGILGNNQDAIIASWKEANTLEQSASNVANELSRAAGNAWGIYSGLSAAVSVRATQAGVRSGAIPPQALADLPRSEIELRREAENLRRIENERRERERTTTTDTGSTTEGQEDYLNGLLREIQIKKSMIGLSEQEAAKQKLLNTLEAKGIDLNDDRVQTLLEEQKRLADLEKSYEAQQQMVGLFKDTLTNALMSIVDGSKSVAGAFKNMMRQILSSITQKSIIQPLVSGLTGGIAGGAAGGLMGGLAGGTGIAATMGTIGSSLGAGFMTSVYGGLAGTAGAVSGGLAIGGATGIATAIGAVAAPLLAVAAVFSFFKKKTKELDSGIRATVNNMDSYIETFRVIETKRFFGLSKKVRTHTTPLAADNPVSAAIASVQQSIFDTAQYLGIATDSLNGFSYEFELSLKGLSEEARMQKITEEVNKLTDAFAGLLPNVQNMQHLNAIMDERYSLETRLLQAQGDTEALRARELASTNEYNRSILEQIYAAEDAKAAMDALNTSLKEADFATLLDFNRAQAYARLGMTVEPTPLSAPQAAVQNPSTAIQTATSANSEDIKRLRSDMKQMHKESMLAYSKIIKNGKDSRDTLRQWNVTGLPEERAN